MSPVANECIPLYEPGARITGHASAAITGKRFLDISGDKQGPVLGADLGTNVDGGNILVAHATAAGPAIGVSSHDCAINKKVTVIQGGYVVPVTAGAAIDSGAEVEVGANGTAVPLAAGRAVGRAFDDAANGEDALIKLYEVPLPAPAP